MKREIQGSLVFSEYLTIGMYLTVKKKNSIKRNEIQEKRKSAKLVNATLKEPQVTLRKSKKKKT